MYFSFELTCCAAMTKVTLWVILDKTLAVDWKI